MYVRPYSDEFKSQIQKLIINILENELGFVGEENPDLENIPDTYQKDKGNFWIAIKKGKVIGTIALKNYHHNRGYLKRLFVHKKFRRRGVASKLFSTLVQFAKESEYCEIYLETDQSMVAAGEFYKKKGFLRINTLPAGLPFFVNTIFYIFNVKK